MHPLHILQIIEYEIIEIKSFYLFKNVHFLENQPAERPFFIKVSDSTVSKCLF